MSPDTEGRPVKTPTPASGERRAIGGYYPQYRIAAFLTLRALREENLEWIRVADPEAGRVDDFQIGMRGRVDAFQVKWPRYADPITFRQLTGQDGLITQLGDGWKRLRGLHPRSRVVVHLVTNQTPSVNDNVGGTGRHTAAFIEEVWRQVKDRLAVTSWIPPEAWRSAWEEFRDASTLPSTEFTDFVRDCELEFSYRLPATEDRITGEDQFFAEDLRRMTESLFATVADPAQIVQITHDELLSRLGWRDRVEFRSRHEFPVDESLYEPIAETLEEFGRALGNLESGYLGVLGSPGSGKSTLLTQCLRTRPERIIRYYAYVPDAQDPLQVRGEAANFLHDLVHALEQSGFRVGASLSRFDRGQLLHRFHEQLRLLHEDWRATGRKTIILIDGLDHIERELRPDRSLLLDLPVPEQVPQGVVIVLGSQTDQLTQLPDQVQYMIRQPDRRIEVRPLARGGVYRILERALARVVLTHDQRERVYQLSDGHPLALTLLINQLRGAKGADGATTVLDQTEAYTGNIESQYHSYWRQVEDDDELTHLLGLAARLRRVVDLNWIESWAGTSVVSRFRRKLDRYFRIEAPDRWYFFHNSFRLFVIKQTLQIAPGKIDPSREEAFQREVADRCAASNGYLAWEELYHRVAAEQHDVVLQRATPAWFRQQLLAFRPIEAIETDIRLALRSVATLQDPVALSRLNFVAAEMSQRNQNLDNLPLVELLLSTGKHDVAVEHVRDGNRLRVTQSVALHLSKKFLAHGLDGEAGRLFELSEPVDLLAAAGPIEDDPQGEKRSLLEAWASAAPFFRTVDEVIRNISRLQYCYRHAVGEEVTADGLRDPLLFAVGLATLESPNWSDFARVLAVFEPSQERDAKWWFWLNVHGWRRASVIGDSSRAQAFVNDVLTRLQAAEWGDEEHVMLAEAVCRINRDVRESKMLLVGIAQPPLVDDFGGTRTTITPFLHRFRLNRLLIAFGDERPLTELVSAPEHARYEGIVYFERAICVIAKIWGMAWRGSVLDQDTLIREVTPLVHLYYHRPNETHNWSGWYFLERLRGEFYDLLIDTLSQHGFEPVEALADVFDEEWRGESQRHWPVELRRSILLALFDAAIAKDWIVERLGRLESVMFEGQDVSGRVSECRAQAEAWLHLGERERAHTWIERGVQRTLGIGYRKDYQLNDWIYWLTLVNKAEPERARARILWFARAVLRVDESTERRAATLAANELLKSCFRWSPRRGVSLFQFFTDHLIVGCEDAICEVLVDQLDMGSVPADMALYMLADFIVPVARDGDEKVAAAFLNFTAETKADVVTSVRYLVAKASVFGLPSARRKWRRGLARACRKKGIDLAVVGLTAADLRQDPGVSTGGGLHLRDGSIVEAEAVETQVDSVTALESLLERQSEDSYFNWEPILTRIANRLGLADIDRIAVRFETGHRVPFALAVLAERAKQLGDVSRAWALGLRALDTSSEYGWSKWTDGGSRLAAFRALVRTDKRQSRELAYQTLARDGGGAAGNLDAILPLLIDEIPVKEIWSEVESYVTALFEGIDLRSDEPDHFGAEAPPNDSTAQAFADLLASHIDHAATLVAQSAQRACAKLISSGNVEMQRAVQELLTKDNGNKEHALFLLEALATRHSDSVVFFRSEINTLTRSRNYAVRRSAMGIIKSLGWELPSTDTPAVELPPIYELVLPPPRPDFLSRTELRSELVLPDTRDARELILPFEVQFDALAEISTIPRANIYHRAVQIMEALVPRERWSAQGERRLRAVLDSAGLKFSFRRPRAVLARRALFHMVGELLDAERISFEEVAEIDSLLTFDDPVLLFIEPVQRPAEVAPIPREERKRKEEWIEQIEEVRQILRHRLENGWRVIAEKTTLKKLEWGVPTETRCSVVSASDPASPAEEVLTKVPASQIGAYWGVNTSAEARSLAIQNNAFMYDTIGANWLGFNPELARDLGWNPGAEGMLSWENGSGQILAKTIWWTDGALQHHSPPFDDEIGEGWLVVVSPEAWAALNSRFASLSRVVSIERAFTMDERDERRKTFDYVEVVK